MKIQKINTNKKGMGGIMSILSIVVIVLLLGVGGYYGFVKDGGMFSFSAGGGPTSGNGAWSEKFVNFDFNAKNQYTGSTVDPSIEVYVEEPISCWNKPRETTCDETSETTATLSSGTVTIKDLKPGHYFAVSRLSSYYPIYVEFDIPNGPQTSTQSLSDYNQAPDSSALKMQEADALTTSNKTFSVSVNTTGKEYTLTDSFTVSDNKCFKLWKISVTEDTNSLTDKGSQVSYEGVREYKITVNGGTRYEIINLANGVTNGFSADGANQKYDLDLESREISICDGASFTMQYYLKANTIFGGNSSAGNELLHDQEVVARMQMYDVLGTKAPTTDYFYVKGASA